MTLKWLSPFLTNSEVNFIPGVPSGVESAVKEAIVVHKSLVTLTPTNHLKLIKVHTFAHRVDPKKLKGWYNCLSFITQHFYCFKVAVSRVVVPCSLMDIYRRLGRPCSLRHQDL